jgi:hypothetical protein
LGFQILEVHDPTVQDGHPETEMAILSLASAMTPGPRTAPATVIHQGTSSLGDVGDVSLINCRFHKPRPRSVLRQL